MKILVLQNRVVPKGINYVPRDDNEIEEEFKKIRSFAENKYKSDPEIKFYRDDRATPERITKFSKTHDGQIMKGDLLHMALDIGVLSNYTPEDVVIFSRDHFYDHYCNVLQQICQFYSISYIVMQD